MIDFKMMGVSLAAAVLIDATIVRAVLLPSVIKLLGDRNWYLPAWLEWLPQSTAESPSPVQPSQSATGSEQRPLQPRRPAPQA